MKESEVHLIAVLFVHRQQQVIENFCHGFQTRSPWKLKLPNSFNQQFQLTVSAKHWQRQRTLFWINAKTKGLSVKHDHSAAAVVSCVCVSSLRCGHADLLCCLHGPITACGLPEWPMQFGPSLLSLK